MKQILINYRKEAHQSTFRQVLSFAREANKLGEVYSQFANEIGLDEPFNSSLLQDLIHYGRKILEVKIDKVVLTKDKPLHKYYRENYYGNLKKVDPFISTVQHWPNGLTASHHIPSKLKEVKNLPWKDGKIDITDIWKDEIKPLFDVYATTPQEIELWNRYKALSEAYNGFQEYANELGVFAPTNFNQLFGLVNQTIVDKVEINPFFFPLQPKNIQL